MMTPPLRPERTPAHTTCVLGAPSPARAWGDDVVGVGDARARVLQPQGWGGARCRGSAVAKDAERQYWWSWRGIHVDPNAPLTNDELGELKDALMEKNWSWGMGEDANATWSDADADADAEAVVAPCETKEKNRRDA